MDLIYEEVKVEEVGIFNGIQNCLNRGKPQIKRILRTFEFKMYLIVLVGLNLSFMLSIEALFYSLETWSLICTDQTNCACMTKSGQSDICIALFLCGQKSKRVHGLKTSLPSNLEGFDWLANGGSRAVCFIRTLPHFCVI